MEILGTLLSRKGHPLPAVRHGLAKATTAFYNMGSAVCNPEISLRDRLQEFAKRVQPVAAYGCSAWVWSRSVYNEIMRWENSLLRKCAKVRRRPEDDVVKHIKRATKTARMHFHGAGHVSLITRWLDSFHRVAGQSFGRLCIEACTNDDPAEAHTDYVI